MVRSERFGPASNRTGHWHRPHTYAEVRDTQAGFSSTSNNVIAKSCHEIREMAELTVHVYISGHKGHECIHGLQSYQWTNMTTLFIHISTVTNCMWSICLRPLLPKLDNVTMLYQSVIHNFVGYIFCSISCGVKAARCLGLKTLPTSCAICLEILEASTFWGLKRPVQACIGFA
jgi:hypothetical protein